jgi:hypothetical protein
VTRMLAGIAFLGWSVAAVSAQGPAALVPDSPPTPAPPPPPANLPTTTIPPPPPDQWPAEPPAAFVVPSGPRPGFFGAVDFSLLFPHVKHDVGADVPITYNVIFIDFPPIAPPRSIDNVNLPFASQDATLAPKFTLGWRFDGDRGAVQLTYRNLASEGNDWISNFDAAGDGALRSRIDLNEVGLNYSTTEHPLGALWGIRWEAGARLATIYHDSQAFGQALGQMSSNFFIGAGPQAALDVTREFPDTGFAFFSRIDAADYLGRIQQKFSERLGDPRNPYGFGFSQQDGSQAVPYVGVQAGFSWLSHLGRYRVTAGYEFDQWWNTARIGDSRGYVQAQGLFLRTEYNY